MRNLWSRSLRAFFDSATVSSCRDRRIFSEGSEYSHQIGSWASPSTSSLLGQGEVQVSSIPQSISPGSIGSSLIACRLLAGCLTMTSVPSTLSSCAGTGRSYVCSMWGGGLGADLLLPNLSSSSEPDGSFLTRFPLPLVGKVSRCASILATEWVLGVANLGGSASCFRGTCFILFASLRCIM